MDWLNYHHLHYFWRVAREGSLTRASAALRLSPSTVSAQIGVFERALGEKLFERRGRGLAPTEVGRMVLGYADEIFALGEELAGALRSGARTRQAKLVVGVTDSLPKVIVRRLLEPALRHADGARLVCREDRTFEELVAELGVHQLDVVLADRAAPAGGSPRAASHLLGECGTTFFAARRHQKARRRFPKSLAETPCLLPRPNTGLGRALEAWFTKLEIRPQVVAEFDDPALMNDFGRSGLGVFPAPTILEGVMARSQGLAVIGRAPELRQRFYAITAQRRLEHPAVIAIRQAARRDIFG